MSQNFRHRRHRRPALLPCSRRRQRRFRRCPRQLRLRELRQGNRAALRPAISKTRPSDFRGQALQQTLLRRDPRQQPASRLLRRALQLLHSLRPLRLRCPFLLLVSRHSRGESRDAAASSTDRGSWSKATSELLPRRSAPLRARSACSSASAWLCSDRPSSAAWEVPTDCPAPCWAISIRLEYEDRAARSADRLSVACYRERLASKQLSNCCVRLCCPEQEADLASSRCPDALLARLARCAEASATRRAAAPGNKFGPFSPGPNQRPWPLWGARGADK